MALKWKKKSPVRLIAVLLAIISAIIWTTLFMKDVRKDVIEEASKQNSWEGAADIDSARLIVTNLNYNLRDEGNSSLRAREDTEGFDSTLGRVNDEDRSSLSSEIEKFPRVYNRLYSNMATLRDMNASRPSVLIVAQARTGSSFLGDAFNQNPDVFYLFEPLYGVNRPSHDNDADALPFLKRIFDCTFTPARYVLQIARFRRFSSNALSTPPLCLVKTYFSTRIKRCKSLDPANMRQICLKKYRAVVSKVLTARLPEQRVDSLFPICSPRNCTIFYLVRDPRAFLYSQMKVGMINWAAVANASVLKAQNTPHPLLGIYCRQICERMEENVRAFQRPQLATENSFILRYEDLAKNPIETLKRVYNISGIQMANSTLHWIKNSTGNEYDISRSEERNEFSTKRNSKAVIDKWRLEMEHCIVIIVEKSCRRVMKLLGYKPIAGSKELQYNLNFSLSDE